MQLDKQVQSVKGRTLWLLSSASLATNWACYCNAVIFYDGVLVSTWVAIADGLEAAGNSQEGAVTL